MDFYHSISKALLTKSLNYAMSITTIAGEVIETVFRACKSLLFDRTSVSVKKDNSDFDVTMEAMMRLKCVRYLDFIYLTC